MESTLSKVSISVSQLKRDSDHRGGIDRLTVLRGRTIADFRGGIGGILLQPVAEAADDAQNAEGSGLIEEHFEYHISFDPSPSSFLGVARPRFKQDFERLRGNLMRGGGLPDRIGSYRGTEGGGWGFGFG
jgi:hypothetical protein